MKVAVGCLVCMLSLVCLVEPRYLPTRSGPQDRLTILRQMIKHLLEEESSRVDNVGYETGDRIYRRDLTSQHDANQHDHTVQRDSLQHEQQQQSAQMETVKHSDQQRKPDLSTNSLNTH